MVCVVVVVLTVQAFVNTAKLIYDKIQRGEARPEGAVRLYFIRTSTWQVTSISTGRGTCHQPDSQC